MRQSLLFPDEPVKSVDEALAQTQLRLLSLNVRNPSEVRAANLFEYILSTQANLIVLTELKRGSGFFRLASSLESVGFSLHGDDFGIDDYFTIIASKGFEVQPLCFGEAGLSHRVPMVRLQTTWTTIDVVGVYGPSNNMTDQSSQKRKSFQEAFHIGLAACFSGGPLILAGDLNVVEPGHLPRLPAFRDHDFDFYKKLKQANLLDAYREVNPQAREHSWYDRSGVGQRLDHAFISQHFVGRLEKCWYDHEPRLRKLSDHSGLFLCLRGGPSTT